MRKSLATQGFLFWRNFNLRRDPDGPPRAPLPPKVLGGAGPLHYVLLGAVVFYAKAHFVGGGDGELGDAGRVELICNALLRGQTKVRRGAFYFYLYFFHAFTSVIADGSRTRTAPCGPFSALFRLSSLPCVSKAASSARKIARKLLRMECEAVSGERICVRARKNPQGILANAIKIAFAEEEPSLRLSPAACGGARLSGLSDDETPHGRKSAVRNRRAFGSRQLYVPPKGEIY